MVLNEANWRYDKILDRIWMQKVKNECIWNCLCDSIWKHIMVYGCISAHMDVYESIQWYMNVNGSE